MRVLFTGASSFTGHWFGRELAGQGHEIVAVFPRGADEYDGIRARRVEGLDGRCRREFGVRFGDERFLGIIRSEGPFDLLAHHAARVGDYRSPDFDVAGALADNTLNLRAVLDALAEGGTRRVLLTGSVFERGEGAGSGGLPSFSPYGLSKALTADTFAFFCDRAGLHLGKFVIPNPFGPMEEPRFSAYLARTWFAGKTAGVRTPDYVRDNIHVTLLAKAYAEFAEELPGGLGHTRLGPSGYAESQGAFARRFAAALAPRLSLPCELELGEQTDWSEPAVRINTDVPDRAALGFDEARAWDELADFYREEYGAA